MELLDYGELSLEDSRRLRLHFLANDEWQWETPPRLCLTIFLHLPSGRCLLHAISPWYEEAVIPAEWVEAAAEDATGAMAHRMMAWSAPYLSIRAENGGAVYRLARRPGGEYLGHLVEGWYA